ncbi:NAD-binding protein [Halobacterium yunchengense]|uniref:NAD-binding protein n=1 Tax=Halobacterium yunchengense TaxID=3108497 RepID=UPI00300AD7FC
MTDARDGRGDVALEELFDRSERVRLVDWSGLSGAKTTVLLLSTVAVVSFLTGLSHLTQPTVSLGGPLAGLAPGASGVVRLYGVLWAFVLAALTVGLQRRLRVAFYGVLVALPLVALVPLVTASATDLPLLVASAVAVPHVVRNRRQFDEAVSLSAFQTAAVAAFVGVQVYGTVGAYVLRGEFVRIDTLTDAFYYIIVTGTTVGYGDMTPTSSLAKLFTLSVIVLGTGSFTVATGSLVVPAIESRISSAFGQMSASELSLFEDHVLVLGHGDLTAPLLDTFDESTDVVVVTEDTAAASSLRDAGVNVLTADPTDGDVIGDARVETASGVVVATDDDARDVLAVLAARKANPDVRIVAAATDSKHVETLADVGADDVVSPTDVGARLLGRSVRGDPVSLFSGDAEAQ